MEVKKPEMILSYNAIKQGIDISDQMASYFTPLRKSIRWYHKIAFEYLLTTAIVNALVIFRKHNQNKVQIAEFRKSIIESLCDMDNQSLTTPRAAGGRSTSTRHRCVGCYSEMREK